MVDQAKNSAVEWDCQPGCNEVNKEAEEALTDVHGRPLWQGAYEIKLKADLYARALCPAVKTGEPGKVGRLALERALTENTSGYYSDLFHRSQDRGYPEGAILRESSFLYAADREDAAEIPSGHTVDDYYAMPDDQRMELIGGVFYDMGLRIS